VQVRLEIEQRTCAGSMQER